MAVTLTVSKTLTGSATADLLTGGSTGYNFGNSPRGSASPPAREFFLRHDGVNKIENLALNVQAYTGVYGGNYSAATDLAKLLAHGDDDFGLQVDFRWDGSPRFSALEQIATGNGDSFSNRILIPSTAMSYNDTGSEVAADAPMPGELGAIGDTDLGDRVHIALRYMTPASETLLGRRQWDTFFSYNFSS